MECLPILIHPSKCILYLFVASYRHPAEPENFTKDQKKVTWSLFKYCWSFIFFSEPMHIQDLLLIDPTSIFLCRAHLSVPFSTDIPNILSQCLRCALHRFYLKLYRVQRHAEKWLQSAEVLYHPSIKWSFAIAISSSLTFSLPKTPI